MEDKEAESTVHDVKIYSKALVLAITEKKYEQAADYINKLRSELDKISLYVDRKKVAF
jgi:hypothetical protein